MRKVALALLLAGCSLPDSGDGWAGTEETLPNGAVRVTSPAQGIWGEEAAWRLEPELVLGAMDGPDHLVIAAVAGLEVDDEGRIYVLDRQLNQLRLFAADGSHIRSVGRAGSGPGEYQNANGLLWLASDSLLVVDQSGMRYSVLDGEGVYVRSVPRRLNYYGWAFTGGLHDGHVYEISSVASESGDRVLAALGTLVADEAAAGSGEAAGSYAASSSPAVPVDTILLPFSSTPSSEPFSVRTERAGMTMGVPFASNHIAYLGPDGGLWSGHGEEFRIVRFSLAGDTLMEIVVDDAVPTPVSPAEIEEWAQGEAPSRFREMGGEIDFDRIPQVKPYFDGFYSDPEGYLWVSVPSAAGRTTFAVFDPAGRYLGTLESSGWERVSYLPPVVRNERLYVVGRDALDVERVYVFRIER